MWWEQMKERLKNIFTKEVEVEEIIEIEVENHEKQSDIQTKMTYQYPSRQSFKFPVIPDNTKSKTQQQPADNQPSFKRRDTQKIQERRQRRRSETDRNESNSLPERQRKKSSMNGPQKEEVSGRKVYKKNPDVPFQPTEVPSPIYGFQKRESKIIHEVPAFKRKEESKRKNRINQEAATVEKDIREETVQMTGSMQEETEAVQESEVNEMPLKAADQRTFESDSNQLVKHEEEQDNREKPEMEASVDKKRNPIYTTSSRESEKKQTERRAPSSAGNPFNVMMTPRDKKKFHDQKKREETYHQLYEAHQKREENLRKAERRMGTTIPEIQTTEKENVQTESKFESKKVPLHLLNDPPVKSSDDKEWLMEQQELLEKTLKYFQVRAKVVHATQGPSVTRFEVQPEMGVKVSKIKNLADDLKLNMSAKDIRIEAPIPGKNTVGIEVPNHHPEMVGLQRIIDSGEFKNSASPLTVALGLTIEGHPKVTDIHKMPHGLIAGATGSGKSVCINTILISLIYNTSYKDVKILLIDPKMVELAPYNGIPHLVSPVITDVKAATQSLKWAVSEMEDRYERFVQEGVRDIDRYNQKMMRDGKIDQKMPFIVIVIDELADLMMMSPQDVEDAISRIAQKARACGIHLLLATQRPSVDVITGLIKANIPTRIAFSVSSQVDSRTIIDSSGAEKLLGRGDMLFVENGSGKSVRLQGPFVSDEEIERVTNFARSIAEPQYLFEQEELLQQIQVDEEEDELLEDAIDFVLQQNSASTSSLQRHFKIGYNRAARLIDSLEHREIISGQNGSRAREVLITKSQRDSL